MAKSVAEIAESVAKRKYNDDGDEYDYDATQSNSTDNTTKYIDDILKLYVLHAYLDFFLSDFFRPKRILLRTVK